jgi:16S rRNA (cytidine1402-2'-O)-methyltransferase
MTLSLATLLEPSAPLTPGLYIVPVPLGNSQDITLRALQVLAQVDFIGCEDTRTTEKLLRTYQITKPLMSLHDHNEQGRVPQVLERLSQGQSMALVSDAGTPLISDPGYRVVQAVIQAGMRVIPLPGPCAFVCALSAAGLPTHHFYFHGFLKPKQQARQNELAQLKGIPETLIFYEAPHRVQEAIEDVLTVFGNRQVVVARELTKTYESFVRGTAQEVLDYIREKGPLRGEIVLMVAPPEHKAEEADLDELLRLSLDQHSLKTAVQEIMSLTGMSRKDVYARALALKGPQG